MALEVELIVLARAVQMRLGDLVLAPLNNQNMLWAAIPLLIATLFITLYFGRNRREELGWNTAFGNTMVFLFVAMDIIRTMYNYGGSWESVFSSKLYLLISLGLVGASALLMFITYFHLLPKRLAFFIFSAPPINVSVYVVMSIVYSNVPPDWITAYAGVAFLGIILILGMILRFIVGAVGLAEPETLEDKVKDEVAEDLKQVKKEREEKVKELQDRDKGEKKKT